MKKIINSFFNWYNKHLTLNIAIATVLFALQIIHLYWLAADVIALKLLGESFLPLNPLFFKIIILVDYTEIPALISTALIYINHLRTKGYHFKSALFIFLLASQFLHIFWITDTFVIETFAGRNQILGIPSWLAWVAILIDYLEVPVIIDTVRQLIKALSKGQLKKAGEIIKERE
jgi:hypothetical protein